MLRAVPFYILFVPLTLFLALVAIVISLFESSGRVANRTSLFWGRALCLLAGVKVRVDRGDFDPAGRYILMVNHRSWFDIPILMAALKGHQIRFVAKEGLFRIPFFGHAMNRLGYISIDRENPRRGMKSIQEAIAKSAHASILIFPEGTRNEELGEFRIGGMILAIKSGRPIVPILVAGSAGVLPKDSLRIRPGVVAVRFFPKVEIQDAYTLKDREKLKQDLWSLMHAHCEETKAWLKTISP